MSTLESNTSPEAQTESVKSYDVRDAEAYLPFRTDRLGDAISRIAGTLEARIASQMDWLDGIGSRERQASIMTNAMEDALRQEKTAAASFREMRSLSWDYGLLPEDKRERCAQAFDRSRETMEQARNAMDKLLADPRASELLDEETLAEIRRERPSYDTSPLSA